MTPTAARCPQVGVVVVVGGGGGGVDADGGREEELELPPGCVAWVVPSTPLKLYTSREALEALRELGAAVVGKGTGLSKQEVTHIVVAEGTEAGAVPRSACPDATVVSERCRPPHAAQSGDDQAPAADGRRRRAPRGQAARETPATRPAAAGGGKLAREHGQRGGARAPRPRAVGAAVFD